ncbi:MAG: T9SS type A sorting domain-containing protein [Candidatus Aegiribacteria sp.]|nr:T9SS type A sorting domain-containing protein [Candidatus Aegiribacteria sp.]
MATDSPGWEVREGQEATVFDGKMWAMGGCGANSYFNDVWHSSDGINWTCATTSAPWSGRVGHEAVSFDGKLWVIGGGAYLTVGFDCENDVWSSVNGVDWTKVTDSAQWAERMGHTVVVYDNKMWLLGGGVSLTSTVYNDVWYSTDGENWTRSTASAPWQARESHSSVVHNNKMWVIGGNNGSGPLNDVWCTGNVGINEESSSVVSSCLAVSPNPIQGVAHIEFTLPREEIVTIRIYDAAGRLARHLLDQDMPQGSHNIIWDGTDDSGMNLSNGIYIFRIETGTEVANKVISLMN